MLTLFVAINANLIASASRRRARVSLNFKFLFEDSISRGAAPTLALRGREGDERVPQSGRHAARLGRFSDAIACHRPIGLRSDREQLSIAR